MTPKITNILSIAGFDGSCGAGSHADIKTFSALQCYGTSILTALTIQNTQGVSDVCLLPIKVVEDQFHSIFSDIDIDAVKTGMLYNKEIVMLTAHMLKRYHHKHIVIDPVIYPTIGKKLQGDDAIEITKNYLLPIASIVTPNIAEAESLSGISINNKDDMLKAAKHLASYGPRAVLVKGGHFKEKYSDDLLYITDKKTEKWLSAKRIQTRNNHGTGCSLASAIAAHLGKGQDLEAAVTDAKEFITGAINAAKDHKIGHGHGPVQHFWKYFNY